MNMSKETVRKSVGYGMLILLFGGPFIAVGIRTGWHASFMIFCAIIITVALIALVLWLISPDVQTEEKESS